MTLFRLHVGRVVIFPPESLSTLLPFGKRHTLPHLPINHGRVYQGRIHQPHTLPCNPPIILKGIIAITPLHGHRLARLIDPSVHRVDRKVAHIRLHLVYLLRSPRIIRPMDNPRPRSSIRGIVILRHLKGSIPGDIMSMIVGGRIKY